MLEVRIGADLEILYLRERSSKVHLVLPIYVMNDFHAVIPLMIQMQY